MMRTKIKKRRLRVILDIWPHWTFQPLQPFNNQRIVGGFAMEYPPLVYLKRGQETSGGIFARLRPMNGPYLRCLCLLCKRVDGDRRVFRRGLPLVIQQ